MILWEMMFLTWCVIGNNCAQLRQEDDLSVCIEEIEQTANDLVDHYARLESSAGTIASLVGGGTGGRHCAQLKTTLTTLNAATRQLLDALSSAAGSGEVGRGGIQKEAAATLADPEDASSRDVSSVQQVPEEQGSSITIKQPASAVPQPSHDDPVSVPKGNEVNTTISTVTAADPSLCDQGEPRVNSEHSTTCDSEETALPQKHNPSEEDEKNRKDSDEYDDDRLSDSSAKSDLGYWPDSCGQIISGRLSQQSQMVAAADKAQEDIDDRSHNQTGMRRKRRLRSRRSLKCRGTALGERRHYTSMAS